MFKVETIQQYKVIKYLKEEFDLCYVKLSLIDRFTIQMIDQNEDSAIFRFDESTDSIKVVFDDEFINC